MNDDTLINAILDKPIPFTMGSERIWYLYQPSLGVSLLAGQLLQELNITPNKGASEEILSLCETQYDLVVRIIALHTFPRRSDILKEDNLVARISELKSLRPDECATLIVAILSWDGRFEQFIQQLGLDKERRTREKIFRAKKNQGGTLMFGGKSLYGTILDTACERYGWEIGYVLWGISMLNLNMLLADSVQTIFLTKEEAKDAHVSTDGIYLDATDPNNLQQINDLIKGR